MLSSVALLASYFHGEYSLVLSLNLPKSQEALLVCFFDLQDRIHGDLEESVHSEFEGNVGRILLSNEVSTLLSR